MPIDLRNERPRSLTEAAHGLPNRPSVRTLFRWAQKGVSGIVLETIKLGHRRYTTDEALERFFERVTAAGSHTETPQNLRDRDSRVLAAERELDQAGIERRSSRCKGGSV